VARRRPIPAVIVHELSVPGGRPLCGAERVAEPPRPPGKVTCPSCARLLADATRRAAHAAGPREEETED
jgi:hypothetical protein